MSIRSACLALVILFFGLSAHGAESVLTINYPPDNSVREFDIVGLSVNLSKEAVSRIAVNVNGIEKSSIDPDNAVECFTVPVTPGINNIELVAYNGEIVLEKFSRVVFRRSELASQYRSIPTGFKRDYFHMETREQCTKCHVLEPNIYDIKPISPATFTAEKFDSQAVIAATSTCYSCHKNMMSQVYAHGPASVWSCLSCHESDTIPEYSVKKPDSEMCYGCHVEQMRNWMSKKYSHGPVTIGMCTICHSPHGSQNEFNLFKATWDLCINCHAEKADGVHVIGGSLITDGHPTRDRPDPVRIGKELTCASCHDPHASNFPHLWAFDVTDLFELCSKCHKNYSTQN